MIDNDMTEEEYGRLRKTLPVGVCHGVTWSRHIRSNDDLHLVTFDGLIRRYVKETGAIKVIDFLKRKNESQKPWADNDTGPKGPRYVEDEFCDDELETAPSWYCRLWGYVDDNHPCHIKACAENRYCRHKAFAKTKKESPFFSDPRDFRVVEICDAMEWVLKSWDNGQPVMPGDFKKKGHR